MRAKLFVGNLNYETSMEDLDEVFGPFQGYILTNVRCRKLKCLDGFECSTSCGGVCFPNQVACPVQIFYHYLTILRTESAGIAIGTLNSVHFSRQVLRRVLLQRMFMPRNNVFATT
jgi:hypothetical protein